MNNTLDTIQLGFLTIYPYGLCVAGGALLGLVYLFFRELKGHLNKGTASWLAVLGIPLAVLFGRLGYVLACLDWFKSEGMGKALQMTDGGFLFYGALAGLLLAGWITARITKQKVGRVMDSMAVPSALLIAAARMGEPLVGAGVGRSIEFWLDPWNELVFFTSEDPSALYRFPFAVQDYYGEWCFGVFFIEAVVAVIITVILMLWRTKRPGTKALIFPALYAATQAALEAMRFDAVLKLGWVKFNNVDISFAKFKDLSFVKVNQLLALPILLAIITIAIVRIPRGKRSWWIPVYGYGTVLLQCGVIAAMEFAMDEKIKILQWMRIDLIFIVMAFAAFIMSVSTCRVLHISDIRGPLTPEEKPPAE